MTDVYIHFIRQKILDLETNEVQSVKKALKEITVQRLDGKEWITIGGETWESFLKTSFNKAIKEGKVKKFVDGEWIPVVPSEEVEDDKHS